MCHFVTRSKASATRNGATSSYTPAVNMIAADDEAHRQKATSEVVAAYQRAFASRSTWAERQSPLDHLRDLSSLLGAADARVPHLQQACAALVQWEDVHVEETADEPDTSP